MKDDDACTKMKIFIICICMHKDDDEGVAHAC